MQIGESEIIAILQSRLAPCAATARDVTVLVADDDASVVQFANNTSTSAVSAPKQLISCDALVEGIHFFSADDLYAIGYKAICANISDILAMGALPAVASLNLILPDEYASEQKIANLAEGLADALKSFACGFAAGDVSRGDKLVLAVSMLGSLQYETQQIWRQDTCKLGQQLWISGACGMAGAYAKFTADIDKFQAQASTGSDVMAGLNFLKQAFYFPQLPYRLVELLVSEQQAIDASCLDTSDGLLAGLTKLMGRSGANLAASIDLSALPSWPEQICECLGLSAAEQLGYSLQASDDYQLLFCVSEQAGQELNKLAAKTNTPLYCIGRICERKDADEMIIPKVDANWQLLAYQQALACAEYKHF